MRKAINPDTLYDSLKYGFSHAVKSEGETLLYLAGQVAWDTEGQLVGPGDLKAQAEQVFTNIRKVLADQGATPADVVRLRTHIVNYSPDMLEVLGPVIDAFYGDVSPAANTLIGVQSLALPEFLIEVDATAVIQ